MMESNDTPQGNPSTPPTSPKKHLHYAVFSLLGIHVGILGSLLYQGMHPPNTAPSPLSSQNQGIRRSNDLSSIVSNASVIARTTPHLIYGGVEYAVTSGSNGVLTLSPILLQNEMNADVSTYRRVDGIAPQK